MAEELAGGKLLLDEPAEAVARISIRNPAKRNALDHDILDAIAELMPKLDRGIETRCVVITGSIGSPSRRRFIRPVATPASPMIQT